MTKLKVDKVLPPPHSAAERGSQIIQGFKLALKSRRICVYTQPATLRPRQAPFSIPFWRCKKESPAGEATLVPLAGGFPPRPSGRKKIIRSAQDKRTTVEKQKICAPGNPGSANKQRNIKTFRRIRHVTCPKSLCVTSCRCSAIAVPFASPCDTETAHCWR